MFVDGKFKRNKFTTDELCEFTYDMVSSVKDTIGFTTQDISSLNDPNVAKYMAETDSAKKKALRKKLNLAIKTLHKFASFTGINLLDIGAELNKGTLTSYQLMDTLSRSGKNYARQMNTESNKMIINDIGWDKLYTPLKDFLKVSGEDIVTDKTRVGVTEALGRMTGRAEQDLEGRAQTK